MESRQVQILELKESILADNDRDAALLREQLREQGTYYINVMSSPGSGKTTTITQIIRNLKEALRIGVMEADIDGDVDAKTIAALGVPAIQLHTGGMCHLDADMSRQGLCALGAENLDLVILENVGNLVCPAEFDTGAHKNIVILSVPEGDDKPLKYPLMFQKADAVLVNKIDALEAFDFDAGRFEQNVRLQTSAPIFPVSAETGAGMDGFCAWLREEIVKTGGDTV